MAKWVVRQDSDGWSVHEGPRRVEDRLSSEEDAVDAVRRRFTPRDTVHLEEADGYRTRITRRMNRRW